MPHHFPFLIQPLQIAWASLGAELTERWSQRGGEKGEVAKTQGGMDCGEKRQGAIGEDGKNDQGQMINIRNVTQKPSGGIERRKEMKSKEKRRSN